ncbi:hypothetical protein ERO13_D10G195550v2 [Gossypium hirsutum]|uniref:Uncharacterized protein n=1 Tax=Gossypium darwinii TaxID=34276 RepID=A0A5D2B527_GOSDA|nr:hypothetical protein ERO13_D10G195550v2 [Gossypium hirsutum]TYG51173.1 hypothetical protein ES288_D10G235700v1 [Gossypium darwinii]
MGSSTLVSQYTETWPSNRGTEGFRPSLKPDSDEGEGSSVDGATGGSGVWWQATKAEGMGGWDTTNGGGR